MSKKWHHDIRFIDGEYVENVVEKYQQTKDQSIFQKLLDNYSIFQYEWAKEFAPHLDNGMEEGSLLFTEVLWLSASKFNLKKCKKALGRAFNAYFVSALLNTSKNIKNTKKPLITCPICRDDIQIIDDKHLMHRVYIDKYIKMFPNYPISSMDGKTICPHNGETVDKITVEYINRIMGKYSTDDWENEFRHIFPNKVSCPITGINIDFDDIGKTYPKVISENYQEDEFMNDFPDFKGIIFEPITQKNILGKISQCYIDNYINQQERSRISIEDFIEKYPNATIEAKKIPVTNPYTCEQVDELTIKMLFDKNISLKQHLESFATILLDKKYPNQFCCPFTGKITNIIKTSDLKKMGKTIFEFYMAVSKYPLRKFQVKCAICGEFTDNIGSHLREKVHNYARPYSMQEYENEFGNKTFNSVIVKSYVSNEEGEQTHVIDMSKTGHYDGGIVEIQDRIDAETLLRKVAESELDYKLVDMSRQYSTVESLIENVLTKTSVNVPSHIVGQKRAIVKAEIKKSLGIVDFDIDELPSLDGVCAKISIPSRDTVDQRLKSLIRKASVYVDKSQ